MSSETRLYCTRVVNAHGYTPKVSSNNYIPRKVLNILLPRIFWFFPPSIFDVIWECQEFSLHLLKTFKCEYKICFRIYSPRDAWFCGYHLAKKKKKKKSRCIKSESSLCQGCGNRSAVAGSPSWWNDPASVRGCWCCSSNRKLSYNGTDSWKQSLQDRFWSLVYILPFGDVNCSIVLCSVFVWIRGDVSIGGGDEFLM